MRTIKVTLQKIAWTDVEAEIPVSCPNPECGADFTTEEHNLSEDQWMATQGFCAIVDATKSRLDYDGFDNCGEYLTTGYRCRGCGHILCATSRGGT